MDRSPARTGIRRGIGLAAAVALTALPVLVTASPVIAVPPLPSAFYGTVTDVTSGGPAPVGLPVRAEVLGTVVASTATYSYLAETVYSLETIGDDADTADKEGGLPGESMAIIVGDGEVGETSHTTTWQGGSNVRLDLVWTPAGSQAPPDGGAGAGVGGVPPDGGGGSGTTEPPPDPPAEPAPEPEETAPPETIIEPEAPVEPEPTAPLPEPIVETPPEPDQPIEPDQQIEPEPTAPLPEPAASAVAETPPEPEPAEAPTGPTNWWLVGGLAFAIIVGLFLLYRVGRQLWGGRYD